MHFRRSPSLLARALPRLGLFLCLASALACRYSIRDTGFVDLGEDLYKLELHGASDDLSTRYRQTAAAIFLDANIEWQRLPPSAPDTALELVLIAPDNRRHIVVAEENVPQDPQSITRQLEAVARSPFRDRLYKESVEAFALVVLIPGTDDPANESARAAITSAIRDVTRLIPQMPKPVDHPPRLIELDPNQFTEETITLWGLGFVPKTEPDPRVAIVYGRGRRLGSVLEGPLITRTALQERLALIGQDCECELDRAWLKGPLFPGRWDPGYQAAAAKSLGFDPENPLVRTEVSRIVLRGPTSSGGTQRLTGPALALGYSEESLDFDVLEDVDDTDASTALKATEDDEIIQLASATPSATPSAAATTSSGADTSSGSSASTVAPTPDADTDSASVSRSNIPPHEHPEHPVDWDDTGRMLWILLGLGVVGITGIGLWLWRRSQKEQG